MFKVQLRDWVKNELRCGTIPLFSLFPIFILITFTTILLVAGLVSRTSEDSTIIPPCSQCLYIGLPIVLGIGLPMILSYYFKTSRKLFNKSGFVWEKCPYICWIIKGCIEAVCVGFAPIVFISIVILKYTRIMLAGVGYILWMIIQTIGVIFTIPDGKAESKIKQIWDVKCE